MTTQHCEHRTMKTPRQPCPHPECWHGGRVLITATMPPDATPLTAGDAYAVREAVHERMQLRLPSGDVVWSWEPR